MTEKWEIRKVSTPERIFDKIRTEMTQPVGIMLFGADCEFKNRIVDMLTGEMQNLDCCFNARPDMTTLKKTFSAFGVVTVVLDAERSASHLSRHELVKAMQEAGASTVVGIYVKARKAPIRPLMSSLEKVELNKQITAIEQSNPTADGLDYLIVVEEEE